MRDVPDALPGPAQDFEWPSTLLTQLTAYDIANALSSAGAVTLAPSEIVALYRGDALAETDEERRSASLCSIVSFRMAVALAKYRTDWSLEWYGDGFEKAVAELSTSLDRAATTARLIYNSRGNAEAMEAAGNRVTERDKWIEKISTDFVEEITMPLQGGRPSLADALDRWTSLAHTLVKEISAIPKKRPGRPQVSPAQQAFILDVATLFREVVLQEPTATKTSGDRRSTYQVGERMTPFMSFLSVLSSAAEVPCPKPSAVRKCLDRSAGVRRK